LDVAFSPDGRRIAAKSREAVLLWDTATWAVQATVTGSGADGVALSVSADGRLLATASADRTVRIWDTATWTARPVLAAPVDWLPCGERHDAPAHPGREWGQPPLP
jgi:WD40 repeat protein